ncbi:MAG: hypothetical protein JWL82_363 [Parcubacteria group bacterium]|nr:hypothetical protein [Parcubacteria group bacterium]
MKLIRKYLTLLVAPISVAFLSLVPVAVNAASTVVPDTTGADKLGAFLLLIVYVIDRYLVPVIFALAFIVFIIGVYRYFIAGGANEEKRAEGQKFVMWGLIGFVLMFSVWGLINLLVGSLGFGGQNRPGLPTFTVPESSQSPATNQFAAPAKNTPAPDSIYYPTQSATAPGGTLQASGDTSDPCVDATAEFPYRHIRDTAIEC